MRPVLAGVVSHYSVLEGGRALNLCYVAEMNDALDAQAENDRRFRAAMERDK
jgi:hypothetical protein